VILVVALNPALDITYRVDRVDWAGVNRPAEVHVSPGGKGLNVARVLHALGADVLLTGLAGGAAGGMVRSALDACDVRAALTEIAGETRRTFAVVDSDRDETAMFNEPGPLIAADEYERFLAVYAAGLQRSSAVVLSGSLPPGLPPGTYADLIGAAAQAQVPALLDTSGAPLALGAAAGPAVVKPNLAELSAAVGRPLAWPGWQDEDAVAEVAEAAAALRGSGSTAVVVTLGAAGLLAVTPEGCWRAVPEHVPGNPTGAGDAALAGLARGVAAGHPWPERVADAAALGAAAVAAPVAGQFDPSHFRRALAVVGVSRWEPRLCRWSRRPISSARRACGAAASAPLMSSESSTPRRSWLVHRTLARR
jgi:tagatose 6-phosphate kinase